MPVLTVRHVTTYRYRRPVGFGEHRMMLRPRQSADQKLLSAAVAIVPKPVLVRTAEDTFGNVVETVGFSRRAATLRFTSTTVVDHSPIDLHSLRLEPYANSFPIGYGAGELPDLTRFIERQYLDPERRLDFWVRQLVDTDVPTLELLRRLNTIIFEHFTYRRRHEPGIQEPLQTLAAGSGTCRDFAMLMAEAVRSLGFAARFVSGYLNIPPGEDGVLDGGNTHAWLQIFLPGAGWIDFDPTSGTVGNRDLVRVAVVRDPRQASPLNGTYFGTPDDYLGMSVAVGVTVEPERTATAELVA
jgi:transglutaminase-like putative cysteine protease